MPQVIKVLKKAESAIEQPKAEARPGSIPASGCGHFWNSEWSDVTKLPLPPTYSSVIASGVLEDERDPATHEAYWTGKAWSSIRPHHTGKRLMRLTDVTHWMPMPDPVKAHNAQL